MLFKFVDALASYEPFSWSHWVSKIKKKSKLLFYFFSRALTIFVGPVVPEMVSVILFFGRAFFYYRWKNGPTNLKSLPL